MSKCKFCRKESLGTKKLKAGEEPGKLDYMACEEHLDRVRQSTSVKPPDRRRI